MATAEARGEEVRAAGLVMESGIRAVASISSLFNTCMQHKVAPLIEKVYP